MIGDNDFLLLAGIISDDIYRLFFSDLFLAYAETSVSSTVSVAALPAFAAFTL